MTHPIQHSPLRFAIESSRRSLDLARRLLTGIEPRRFARLPVVGGVTVNTNHPAFIYGHLSLYPAIILDLCGLDARPAGVPDGFEPRFQRDSACVDDPGGAVYPSMDVITSAFFSGYGHLLAALPGVTLEVLDRPTRHARLAATFPTVGFATTFLMGNHVATHLGQVSAWRRCMGLGRA
ncbi:MAG: DinB family protein [Phycisphaerales bacterium]